MHAALHMSMHMRTVGGSYHLCQVHLCACRRVAIECSTARACLPTLWHSHSIHRVAAVRPWPALPTNLPAGVRIVVQALFKALPALGSVLCVALLIYFIFAVLSINVIGGLLWNCQVW
jgi:hypothetical protein